MEYIWIPEQTVPLNQSAIFESSIPCRNGSVIHSDGSGVFILRGIVNNPYAPFARYRVTFNGNIAIPTGGTVGPIAVALTENGEPRQESLAISTPTVVNSFGNVTSVATITVPRGLGYSISLRAVAPPADLTDTPAAAVVIRNANIVIERIA